MKPKSILAAIILLLGSMAAAAANPGYRPMAVVNASPLAVDVFIDNTGQCVYGNATVTFMVPVGTPSPKAFARLNGASCGQAALDRALAAPVITLASVPMTGPAPRLTFTAGLKASAGGSSGSLALVNSSPYFVEFTDGHETRCLSPQGRGSFPIILHDFFAFAGPRADCSPGKHGVTYSRVRITLTSAVGAQVEYTAILSATDR